MKKLTAIILSLVLILCLAACGSSKAEEDGSFVLSIGTSPDFPPFESLDGSGNVSGIEIDILNKVCEKYGWKLEINQMDFDSVLPGVQAGKFLLGVSGITVTEERKQNALFTQPYCMAAQAIVVTADSAISCKADLEGKKVSVQTGTTAESFCMAAGYQVSAYQANSDAQAAVLSGKVDAWVIDDLTAKDMVDTYNAANPGALVVLSEAMTSEPYAFAANKNSADVIEKIDAALDEMLADGTIADIFAANNAPYTAP